MWTVCRTGSLLFKCNVPLSGTSNTCGSYRQVLWLRNPSTFGQIHFLALLDAFQKHDRIGHTTIGRNYQSFQVALLLRLRITDFTGLC